MKLLHSSKLETCSDVTAWQYQRCKEIFSVYRDFYFHNRIKQPWAWTSSKGQVTETGQTAVIQPRPHTKFGRRWPQWQATPSRWSANVFLRRSSDKTSLIYIFRRNRLAETDLQLGHLVPFTLQHSIFSSWISRGSCLRSTTSVYHSCCNLMPGWELQRLVAPAVCIGTTGAGLRTVTPLHIRTSVVSWTAPHSLPNRLMVSLPVSYIFSRITLTWSTSHVFILYLGCFM